MNRNDNLNAFFFDAQLWGDLNPVITAEALRVMGGQDGLTEDEMQRTLQSAVTAANQCWQPYLSWLAAVQQFEQAAPRQRRRVTDAALGLALVAVTTKFESTTKLVTMSSRQLAEELGQSHARAARHLRHLTDEGFLVLRRHRGASGDGLPQGSVQPRAYELALMRASEEPVYIHPLLSHPQSGCMSTQSPHPRLLASYDLRRHVAFQRNGGGPVLSSAGAALLDVLWDTPDVPRRGLAGLLQFDRKSVSAAIQQLESAGLVRCDNGVINLMGADPLADLTDWCESLAVPDRTALRRQRHADQRAKFRYEEQALAKAVKLVNRDLRARGRNPAQVRRDGIAAQRQNLRISHGEACLT